MATYICLLNWTEKGIENVRESPNRLDSARTIFEGEGARISTSRFAAH